jgi:HlyD family secretion protein
MFRTENLSRTAKIAIALIGAGVILGGLYVWRVGSAIAVRTASVQTDVEVHVFGLGTVEARLLSKIGFEVGGALIELNADHGDTVKQGDVLARLQATAQTSKAIKAKAALASFEANIKKAEANVEKARAVLAQRQGANRRRQELASRDVVSAQGAEEAQRDEEVAKGDLAVALSDVEVAKAQLADGRAQLQFETAVVDQHTLRAPFDAMVVDRQKELGTVIRSGDPIFTLVDRSSVWVLAYIDESRSGFVALGQPAEVRLRSLPQQTFQARVMRIGIESDRVTEERRVYVKCEQCPPQFHLGEQAEVRIKVATLARALLVPDSAVQAFDGKKGTVWTVENGRLQRRAVSIRHRTEDARLEIVDGLPDGAQVVIANEAGFKEGRSVRVLAETGK